MHSKELAAKLVAVLVNTCPGIRHDYSLRDIEREFDRTLAEENSLTFTETNRLQSSFGF